MSAWILLVLADVVAVASFARCFTGPGELTAALASLMCVHLTAFAARREFLGQKWLWRVLGVLGAVCVPIAIVLGTAAFSRFPAHAVVQALQMGWATFYSKVAPVPELPGLVLATAWAAGAASLLAELIFSRRRLPAVLALVPAVGLYLFASAFGTGGWRVAGLGAMAVSCCGYLLAVVHGGEETRLVALTEGGRMPAGRARPRRSIAAIVSTVVTALVAATIVSPNLPGGRGAALVAWRGGGAARVDTASPHARGTGPRQEIHISTLVQVEQEEVDNPTAILFTVYSSVPTRELVASLDSFDGTRWSASTSTSSVPLRSFSTSIGTDERRPPAPVLLEPGHASLVQVFDLAALSGHAIPTWGDVVSISGAGLMRRNAAGSIVAQSELSQGSVYAVGSTVSDPSPAQLRFSPVETSDAQYLQLPGGLPPRLVELADRIEAGESTPYEKALALDAYLTSPRFHYRLPPRSSVGGAPVSPGYGALSDFLFDTRSGYCQQFATAFAVLARIEGIPTRIAVGFLPGALVGHDEWQVDGIDTHAWPQVLFEGYGWIDFEPTPGATVLGSSAPGSVAPSTPTVSVTVTTTPRFAPNLRPSPGSGATGPRPHVPSNRKSKTTPTDPWLLVVPLALLSLIGGLPLWRRRRLRRCLRDPRGAILALWRDATRTLDLAGVTRRGTETFVELAKRVESKGLLSAEEQLALFDLARLATAARYAATSPDGNGADQAVREAKTVIRGALGNVALWRQIAAALDPRSLPA